MIIDSAVGGGARRATAWPSRYTLSSNCMQRTSTRDRRFARGPGVPVRPAASGCCPPKAGPHLIMAPRAMRLLHTRKRRTRASVLTGGPGAAPGGGARGCGFEKWVGAYARTEGEISYSPRCLSCCLSVSSYVAVGLFKSKLNTHFPAHFSNTPNTRMPPPRCPWATCPINACCSKRLPLVLGVEGAEGVCSKSKLSTTHNHRHRRRCRRRRRRHHHHHHLLLQLLLKVFVVGRVFFKRPRRRGGWG